MKKITILFSLILLIGCSITQSNIKIDSIETLSLNNYNDFNIKINNSNISAEVNPIVLEQFKENLKNAIQETGLKYSYTGFRFVVQVFCMFSKIAEV